MTTIGGFADGILDGTIPPEQHEKYTRIIADEIHRLRTLVNSMLNLSKFEAGEMQLRSKQFDVGQLLIKTVLMFEKRITDKNVEVEGLEDAALQLYADEDLLFQVLYNLIENAVKYSGNEVCICIDASLKDNRLYMKIKDNGMGIPSQEQERVFEKFYRAQNIPDANLPGIGLRLSYVKLMVEAHGGNITLQSQPGKGTTFTIEIPQ
jgi:signal transduction histidine kinase